MMRETLKQRLNLPEKNDSKAFEQTIRDFTFKNSCTINGPDEDVPAEESNYFPGITGCFGKRRHSNQPPQLSDRLEIIRNQNMSRLVPSDIDGLIKSAILNQMSAGDLSEITINDQQFEQETPGFKSCERR